MKKKSKRHDLMKIIFILIALFLVAGVGLYFYGRMQRKDEPVNVIKVANTIDKYGYTLNDNVSDYYKSEFDILKEMSSNEAITDEDLAKEISKLYTIDLLSLNNKINKYEVTCSQYFYSTKKEMNKQKIIDNFYNLIVDNAYDDRVQELPEVSLVEVVSIEEVKYKLDKDEVDAYEVNLNVSYVKNLGYMDDVVVTLVKEDNRYSVVSFDEKK